MIVGNKLLEIIEFQSLHQKYVNKVDILRFHDNAYNNNFIFILNCISSCVNNKISTLKFLKKVLTKLIIYSNHILKYINNEKVFEKEN